MTVAFLQFRQFGFSLFADTPYCTIQFLTITAISKVKCNLCWSFWNVSQLLAQLSSIFSDPWSIVGWCKCLDFITISISRKSSRRHSAMLPNGSWVCSRCGTSTAHPCQVQRQGDFALEVLRGCAVVYSSKKRKDLWQWIEARFLGQPQPLFAF